MQSETPQTTQLETTSKPKRKRSIRRIALYVLLGLVGVVLLGVLLLQTDFGRERVRRVVERQIQNSLSDSARVSIGRLEGNVLGNVRLSDVAIVHGADSVATVDELGLRFKLLPLLRRRVEVRDLSVIRLSANITQLEDGSFDISSLLPPPDESTDSTGASWALLAESISIQDGRSTILIAGQDSSIVVEDINLAASGFSTEDGRLRLSLDNLVAAATSADRTAKINLAASGSLTDQGLDLTTLNLTSDAGTDVSGMARIAFGSDGLPDITSDFAIDPIALSDIRAFSGLEVYGEPRLRLTSHRENDNLILAVQGTPHVGSTISLDGVLEHGDVLRYQAEGELLGFNPALLTQNQALAANLSGELRVDLAGTTLETLDGPFSATLTDTQVGGQSLERFVVDGSIRNGRVDFGLDSAIPGLDLHAEGTARPFDRTPTYDVRGAANRLDLAGLLRDPTQSTSLAGDFSISGSGFTPETIVASIGADIQSFDSDQIDLDHAQLEGDLRSGLLRFVAAAQLGNGAGTLDASGTMRPFDSPLTYDITDGQFSNLNVAALTGNPTQDSDISGSLTGSGQGFNPQTMRLDLTTSIRDGYFDRFDLAAVDANLTLNNGTLAFDGTADLGRAGLFDVTGSAQPFLTNRPFQANGHLQYVDLAELLNNPSLGSDITSAFSVRGSGTSLQTMTARAELDLDYSSYGAQEVESGQLVLVLRDGLVTVEGDLTTPEGNLAIDFSGRPFDEHPSFTIGEGMCFNALDLATLTGNPSYRTRLSGCFSGDLSGLNLAQASGSGTITLQESTINNATIDSGSIDFTLRDGLVNTTTALELHAASTPESQLGFTLSGRLFDRRPTYAANGTFHQLDLTSFSNTESQYPIRLSGSMEVNGEGLAFDSMLLDALLIGEQSKLGEANLDTLHTAFHIDRGVVQVDTLLLESDLLNATAGGRIALSDRDDAGPSDFELRADVFDLSPLNRFSPQPLALDEGAIRLSIEGEPGDELVLNTTLRGKRVAYGTTAISSFASRIGGTFDPASGTFEIQSDIGFEFLSQPNLLIEGGNLAVSYNGSGLGLGGSVTLDRRRNFAFESQLDISEAVSQLHLNELQMQLDGTDWSLAQPTHISIGEDGYRVQTLLLLTDDGSQQIVADGLINPNGEQSFVLSVEGFQMDSVTDLIGFDGLGGVLSTDLAMSGPAFNPEVFGRMTVRDFTSLGDDVGEIGVDVNYIDDRLDLDANLRHIGGQSLTATGFLPLRFSLADALRDNVAAISEVDDGNEVGFVVRADSLPIGWIRPFFNRRAYTHMEGLLNADVTIDGTQADPQLSGQAELMNGRIGLAVAGRIFETLSASLRFVGNQAVIDRAVLTDSESGFVGAEVDGTITLPKLSIGELDLTVTPHNLLSMETRTYDGLVIDEGAQPIRLSGTLQDPIVRGSAVLSPGTINMTEELVARDIEDVELDQEDLRQIQTVFQRVITQQDTSISRFYKQLDLDINVDIGRNVWLRSSSGFPFAVEFDGEVQAVKAAGAEQTSLFGTVEVTRGHVETLSRRFEIQRGTLVFNGLIDETMIDLEATLDIRTDPSVGTTAVEISLLAQGRLADDLTITLSSTPQLDNADIVSLIASGRLSEDLFGGGALVGTVEGIALSQLSGLMEGLAGNTFGLDVVQIDQEPGGLVIRLGKNLGNKAFVSIGQPIGTSDANGQATNNPQITFEYALMQWLLLQLEYENGVGAGLIYEYAF